MLRYLVWFPYKSKLVLQTVGGNEGRGAKKEAIIADKAKYGI